MKDLQSAWWRVGGASLLVGAAALIQGILGQTFADPPAFFLFLIAIALVARIWGPASGLLAMLLSTGFAIAADWVRPDVAGEISRLVRFLALGITINWVSGSLRAETLKAKKAAEELRAAREALERHAAELERSNRELERFAYIASHDLQEPLRTISTFGTLVQRRFGDAVGEEGREYLQYMVGGANRLSDIVHDLLTYARAGQRRNVGPTDSASDLVEALKLLDHLIRSKGAEVRVVSAMPVVIASDGELVQVFQNLVGNAIKFSDGRPDVQIEARREAEAWCFCVRDRGIGIHLDHHERVFGLFQRLSADTPGTGVGLAICKRIVESLHGRIWIDSAPGAGTAVYFTLPSA